MAARYPYASLTDLCYVQMVQRHILTVQHNRFALNQQILGDARQDQTVPADRVILAFLLAKAVQKYAKAELGWRQRDAGPWFRRFEEAAELARFVEFGLRDSGKLAKLLDKAARKVRYMWNDKNAVGRAFLLARRHLLQQVRLICEELARLPSHGGKSIMDRLSANVLAAFNIRQHTGQDVASLRAVVTRDRTRHATDPKWRKSDDYLRSLLREEITHLRKFPPSQLPKMPSIPSLPGQRH